MNRFSIFLLLGSTLLLNAHRLHAETAYAAIASNFTHPAKLLVKQFEQQTGHTVKTSFGSTGKLFSQIQHGAPFEVFLSADQTHIATLIASGSAIKGTQFTYAIGRLALWSAQAELFDSGELFLNTIPEGRLAIANPKLAPYGVAAIQTLEQLGLSDSQKIRLVNGESISQTFQFVATGNSPAGFVSLSQVRVWQTSNPSKKGSLWVVPNTYHDAIEQQAVLLSKGKQNAAAKALLRFLQQAEAQEIIMRYGYDLAPPKQ